MTYGCYNIDDYIYKYNDPLKAFYSLFTKMKVLNIKYPKICNHVWQFVQQGIFGIPVDVRTMCHTAQEALKVTNM